MKRCMSLERDTHFDARGESASSEFLLLFISFNSGEVRKRDRTQPTEVVTIKENQN